MTTTTPTPNAWLSDDAYSVPRHPAPIDLRLDGNEGIGPDADLLAGLRTLTPEMLRRYPSPGPLEAKLAARFGLDPERVVVTAGGDEGLMRMCRVFLGPGRNLVLPEPSFEMIRRFAEGCQGDVRSVPYTDDGYPTDAVIAACDERTAVIAVVSPNNPTGSVISEADLRRLSSAAPQAMLMVDLAYVEFADVDLTEVALGLSNAIVFRTFSKARGLAGLRVGYAMGAARWINLLRGVGLPYPVSAPALTLATASLEDDVDVNDGVATLRRERER
ncbi:MAG: histidinol-phosphate transaminase, partial [Myxococcota bacterium]|nr:histidinol-phosphate transaminase [Myxococcota bacterium]